MFEISELPWNRGVTAQQNQAVIDPLSFANLEGMEFVVRDASPSENTENPQTKCAVKLRLVRNKSGIYLLPRRVVALDPTNNYLSTNGYAQAANGELAYPVDEFLPPAGVAPNDLFYVVTGGPAQVMLPATTPDNVLVGSLVEVLFATSGTTSTSGRVHLTAFPGTYASGADGLTLATKNRNSFQSLTASNVANAILNVRVPWFGLC